MLNLFSLSCLLWWVCGDMPDNSTFFIVTKVSSKLQFNPPGTWAGPHGSSRPFARGLEAGLQPVPRQG